MGAFGDLAVGVDRVAEIDVEVVALGGHARVDAESVEGRLPVVPGVASASPVIAKPNTRSAAGDGGAMNVPVWAHSFACLERRR